MEAVHVATHLELPGSGKLRHLHAQLSLGQSCHRPKKKSLASMQTGSLHACPTLCDPVDWPDRLLCKGVYHNKNTEAHWPILVVIPFQRTIFPAALAANSSEYLVLPKPLLPKQLDHLCYWPSQEQIHVLQGKLRSNPQ